MTRELDRLRDEAASRRARDYDSTMEASLARSELETAQKRQAEAAQALLDAERGGEEAKFAFERDARRLEAAKAAAELDASAAADRETVALAQVEDLRTTLADAEALLRESRHENAALRRQADVAARPAEQEKLAALRALDQARHDPAPRSARGRTPRASTRRRRRRAPRRRPRRCSVATAAAREADDDWARRLNDAVRDVRDQSLRRDAQQAEEIATLHQALADVEARAQLHVDREHAHFQDARLDADARADENGKLRAAVDELQGRLDGALRALAALEDDERRRTERRAAEPSPYDALATRLEAMRRDVSSANELRDYAATPAPPFSAQPLEPRRSVPPTITENARYSPRGDDATAASEAVSVGVAALAASDADAPRVTRSLDRVQYSLSDADDLRSVNTRNSLATRTSVDSAASAQTAYTHRSLEGPGFHRGYWQRAYGGNPRELFPNAAAA
ncbi:hypothetical protein JL720_3757 [Aureococcus anophagefferens]|nr:hypothetical protein JL720_3757 [Aureococcus anophagefferens]